MEQNYYKRERKEHKNEKSKNNNNSISNYISNISIFGGIYIQTQNRMENKVKDYQLGREISKGRLVELIVKSDNDASKKIEENYEIDKKYNRKKIK